MCKFVIQRKSQSVIVQEPVTDHRKEKLQKKQQLTCGYVTLVCKNYFFIDKK